MISWRHPADSKAALHSSPCNCRCTPGFGRWVPCFSCRCGTAFPASEMAFAGDDFHSGSNPKLIKADSWISFDPQNPHGAMAIYTARKCGLGTYKKKVPGCTERLQEETLRQSSYTPDPCLGEYSQGEEEAACQPDLVLIQLPVRHQSGFLLLGFTCLRNSCSFLGLSRSYRALVAFVCN